MGKTKIIGIGGSIAFVSIIITLNIINEIPKEPATITGLTEFQTGIVEKYCSDGVCTHDGMTRDEKIESYRLQNYATDYDAGLIFDEDGYNKFGVDKEGFDRNNLRGGLTAEQWDEVDRLYDECLERRDNTPERCLQWSPNGLCMMGLKERLWNQCSEQHQATMEQFKKAN